MAAVLLPSNAYGELGSAELQIAGTRLLIYKQTPGDDPDHTVPFDTPTLIGTHLEGYDPDLGVLPSDLRVLGDFSGPEVDGVLTLETVPNEPFRIPRLRMQGDYVLDNVRLVQGEEVLAYAEPSRATILVTQILLSSVSSRSLTLDEIRALGLPIDEDSFQAMNLTIGFAFEGKTIEYEMPVVRRLYGPNVQWAPGEALVQLPRFGYGGNGTVKSRFQPPRVIPFTLHTEGSERPEIPYGGCDPKSPCRGSLEGASFPTVGIILFPTDISLLHQFFSVVLIVQNGAPEGDELALRDMVAKAVLPPGLRLHETEPPTLVGSPVPLRDPGPDGEIGTSDDLSLISAQFTGNAEFLVEGVKQGTHLVHFDIAAVLEGLPIGPQKYVGEAEGAVVVRDPNLSVRFAHPEVVRADIEYPMFVTVTNIGNQPANLVSVTLPAYGLAGVEVADGTPSSLTIDSLLPGDSEAVEFRLVPEITGKMVSTSLRSPSMLDPHIELSVKVGEAGSLSPDALSLPNASEQLPDEVLHPALGLVSLGYSLAEAPPQLGADLPRVGIDEVNSRIFRLKEAGRHLDFGEDPLDVVALLASDWTGGRGADWGWDELRRQSKKGGEFADGVSAILTQQTSTALEAFERFAATTHFLAPQAVLAAGDGVTVEVSSRTSGKAVAGKGLDAARVRDLPFADLYGLHTAGAGAGEMVLLSVPEEGGYEVRLLHTTGGAAELHLLLPDPAAQPGDPLRVVRWTGLSLGAGGTATASFTAEDTLFDLLLDADGDGTFEQTLAGTVDTVAVRPFGVLAAVQDAVTDPSGHVVSVVLTEDVDPRSLCTDPGGTVCVPEPSRFVLPGNTSNGGLVQAEANIVTGILSGHQVIENPLAGLSNSRVVQVVFDQPISPLVASHPMTVSGLVSVHGQSLGSSLVEIETTADNSAVFVRGKVYGADGQVVPNAQVVLYESDIMSNGAGLERCEEHATSTVTTDAGGEFFFDYVRQNPCGQIFRLRSQDPVTHDFGEATGRVRLLGQEQTLNITMPHRGDIRGQVRYDDGTIPENIYVAARGDQAGRLASVDEDGNYYIQKIAVGTVTVAAHDGAGHFAYGTVEVESGGTATRDLVLIRRPETPPSALRGTVGIYPDGEPVVAQAYVALYVDGVPIGMLQTDEEGRFDFGQVPSGEAEIEVFAGASLATAGQPSAAVVRLTLFPDQPQDVPIFVRDDVSTLTGYVYRKAWDNSLTPIAGTTVWIEGTPFHTQTDAAGYYEFEDLFIGNWTVRALAEAGVTIRGSVSVTSGGETVVRDLYYDEPLPNGGIVGQVFGLDGEPVSGARVSLTAGYGATNWFFEAFTNAEGKFILEDVAPGTHWVQAYKGEEGGLTQTTVYYPGDTAWVTIRFCRGTIRIQTLEKDAEGGGSHPILSQIAYQKTEVVQSWQVVALSANWVYEATDVDSGILEISALEGPYKFTAWNGFHTDQGKGGSGWVSCDSPPIEHIVTYEPNGVIRGTVYDIDGETPVQDAEVSIRGGSIEEYSLNSGPEGQFTFPLVPAGDYWITVSYSEGTIYRKQRTRVSLRQQGGEVDVDIVLPKQGSVAGWVETHDGVAVGGAVVELVENHYPGQRFVVNADQDGNFSFDNVFIGTLTIRAQAPELGGLGGHGVFELTSEGEELSETITLEPTGEIFGTVTSPIDGGPVENAAVSLWEGTSRVDSTNSAMASADPDLDFAEPGSYRFRLLPLGFYQVRVWDAETGRKGWSAWTEIVEHGHAAQADVLLQKKGEVQGTFTDGETGQPIRGAIVRLRSTGPRMSSTTDVNGAFEFEGVPAGWVDLTGLALDGRSSARATVQLSDEDEIVVQDLELAPTSTVSGSVLNPPGLPDGPFEPSTNVWIEQLEVAGASFANPYSFDGIRAGRFKVLARENGNFRMGKESGRIETAGDDVTVDVRMQAMGSVTVAVEDADGMPVEGADVSVYNSHDLGKATFYGSTSAGSNQVTFNDLREGRISVRAVDPVTGLRGSAAGELVTEGENVPLLVRLEDSATVRGRAVRADGVTSAAGATVSVKVGWNWHLGVTDEFGNFELDALRLGSYTLVIEEKDGFGFIERLGTLSANGQVDDYGVLVLDEEPPRVISVQPASGATNLPLNASFTVTFSEPMDKDRKPTDFGFYKRSSSVGLSYNYTWSADRTMVTLTPVNLQSGTEYDLYVNTGLVDMAGRKLAFRSRTSFQTADVIPPAVVDTLPRDGDVQVPVDSLMLVTFSEQIVPESVSGTAIQLTDLTAGKGITTTTQVRPGDREIIVTPQLGSPGDPDYCGTPICPDRDIQLTVQGVEDLAGNPMAEAVSIVFWTVDETDPTLAWVTPAEGESFTSGDTVSIEVDASDNRGVAKVDFSISSAVSGAWSHTGTGGGTPAENLSWDVPAPIVTAPESVTITATVTDIFGRSTTWTRDITVSPSGDATPPEITSLCPMSGDLVAPGFAIPIPYTITDDESIESLWLEVDGTVVEHRTPIDAASDESSFLWAPDEGLAAGTSLDVRVKARDFANHVTEHVLVLQVPTGTLLTGDQTIDGSYAGASLALAAGELTMTEAQSLSSLSLLHGATLVNAAPVMALQVTGKVHIQCGAFLDASGSGYANGGAPAGLQGAEGQSGACHGGVGKLQDAPLVCDVYDSVYMPTLGGGGASETGGEGGGAVWLEAGELVVDGELLSRGTSVAWGTPGGAGGSVLIDVAAFSGQGLIDVSGAKGGNRVGNYGDYYGLGSGGGGRLAVYADDMGGFDFSTQARAWAGSGASSAGTLFAFTRGASTYGRLILHTEQVQTTAPVIPLPTLGTGAVTGAVVEGTDDLWIDGPFRERWLGAWMELYDAGGGSLGIYRVIEVGADGRALLDGAAPLETTAASYKGRYRFDEVVFGNGVRLQTDDPLTDLALVFQGEVEFEGEIDATDVTVESNSTLRLLSGPELRIRASGTVRVEEGATIDVSGKGYSAGDTGHPAGYGPPGISTSEPSSGGSHGGVGGELNGGAVGEVYGSVYAPRLGGGGGHYWGGGVGTADGGGVLVIEAPAVVLEGDLLARDNQAIRTSGAGGSVLIVADQLSGGGTIDVTGGPPKSDFLLRPSGGPGGGGRVALLVDDLTTFDPVGQVLAAGGGTGAGVGTVYVRDAGSELGRLYLDGDGLDPVPAALLPPLETGSVTQVTEEGADLRLTASSAYRERWRGAWMELRDGTGAPLGTFEVADVDASGRALLRDAAGSVDPAAVASYAGEYRFDEVIVGSGVVFEPGDQVSSPLVFEGDREVYGTIEAESVLIKAGSTLTPASGDTLRFAVTGELKIETGAVLDVSGLGYVGGGNTTLGGAPPNVLGSGDQEGGSHGGRGFSEPGSGEVYDSVYYPELPGGGGGDAYDGNGGRGGGRIAIEAGSMVLDGQLLADGGTGGGAPGAGGTIALEIAGSLTGSGSMKAAGGYSKGGGGRIAIRAGDLTSFDAATQIDATADCGPVLGGGTGTVFLYSALSSTWGDLRVAAQPGCGDIATTPLPAIGHGSVGSATPDTTDPTDLWITPADSAVQWSLGLVGMWVRVNGVDYPVVAEGTDRRSVLLDGAAGSVVAGDGYVGVYKFDTVSVQGGAVLEIFDRSEATTWDVDADSQTLLLDISPPSIDSITPAAGTVYSSGDEVTLDVEASDDTTVAQVAFEWAGQLVVDSEPPWSWSTRAPAVGVSTDLPVTIKAYDDEDNVTTVAHSLHVDPLVPGDPPAVGFACPKTQLELVPGTALDVVAEASDPLGIDRVEFFFGDDTTPIETDYVAPFTATLVAPASAIEGDLLTLRAKAYNYSTVSAEVTMTVAVVERTLLTGGAVLDATMNGQELFLGPGTYTVVEPLDLAALTLLSGAVVTHGTQLEPLVLDAGHLAIHCGAAIDESELGYDGGEGWESGSAPSWVTVSEDSVGGSHGGRGWWSEPYSAGEVFGSVYQPTLGGGGGSAWNLSNLGGDGGGVVRITASGDLVLEGEIRADGQDLRGAKELAGAGAGGSVVLDTPSLAGGGRISAAGHDFHALKNGWYVYDGVNYHAGGAGGGGRVALYVADLTGFDVLTQVDVTGGRSYTQGGTLFGVAAAGTLYVRQSPSNLGELIVNAFDEAPAGKVLQTELPVLGSGDVSDLSDDANAVDAWLSASEAFTPRWLGVWVVLRDLGGATLGSHRVIDLDETGRILLDGAAGVTGAATWTGEYRFDKIHMLGGAGIDSPDVLVGDTVEFTGETNLDTPSITAQSLTIHAGATVRSWAEELRLSVTGTLRIEENALLDASGAGFAGGQGSLPGEVPAGVTAPETSAGGSHGGRGQDGDSGVAGEIFDSVYQPVYAGGGGGGYNSSNFGGGGGAAVILEATTVELDGEVRSRGSDYSPPKTGAVVGAGAGGTVVVLSGALTGSGTIDVAGGNHTITQWGPGGAGGGGRVALYVGSLNFDAATQVALQGGTRFNSNGTVHSHAAAGTAYVFDTSTSTYGSLYLRGASGSGETVLKTTLPAIGRDVVANPTAAADPADLWIEPADVGAQLDWGVDGMWVRIGGSDYRVTDQGTDRRTMLLAGAAGVAAGEGYEGYYKFDSVTVTDGARLELLDFSEVAVWNVDALSEVDRPDQVAPVIDTVTPADLATFQAGETILVTAEVTDEATSLDYGVASVTLSFDGASLVDDTAPYEWTLTAPIVAGDYPLSVDAVDLSGNAALPVLRTIHINAADPPSVAILCPGDGALLAPSTGLEVTVEASHPYGVDRVELLLDGVLADTATSSPYVLHVDAPLTAVAGQLLTLQAVAYSTVGSSAFAASTLRVVEGTVLGGAVTIAAGDTTYDNTTLVVASGTLTIDGPHTFTDLVVLDGAVVTHSPATASSVVALDVVLTGGLYVACGGAVNADGRGYLAGYGHPNDPAAGAYDGVGGSHGGRGGLFDTTPAVAGGVYGDLFDPVDPGAGGGGASASSGGGVVRIAASGEISMDGVVSARGGDDGADVAHGAGGSIRLDGLVLRGFGSIDASGAGSTAGSAGGSGGRIALYGATIDSGLLARAAAHGGSAATAQATGAAGTVFVKRDADPYGELLVRNLDADGNAIGSAQVTELPALGGTYDFDRVVVDGMATLVTLDAVQAGSPAEVGSGSVYLPSYTPSITITQPADSASLSPGQAFQVGATVDDLLGVVAVTETFDGISDVDSAAPFSWIEAAPFVGASTVMTVTVEATDLSGHALSDTVSVSVEPVGGNPPVVTLGGCVVEGDLVFPGQVLVFPFTATDDEQVVSWSLMADGDVVETQTVATTSISAAPTWTVPADAVPGQSFTIRVEAVDQVGAIGFSLRQLAVPINALSGPASLDATWNGQSLVLGSGTFTVTEPLNLASLTLTGDAVLTGEVQEVLDLVVEGTLRIQCGAELSVSALGYSGGTGYHSSGTAPSWAGAATYTAGASHGGLGIPGNPAGVTGGVYDSVYQPQLSGAGGSADSSANQGGDGGGTLFVTATTLQLEGKILARGEDRVNGLGGYHAGAGAGGSVLLDVGVLTGGGEIDASGGDYDHNNNSSTGAPGGGGRVAIYASDLNGFDPVTQVAVRGGDRIYGTVKAVADTGTLFVFDKGVSTYGRLILDDGQNDGTDRNPSPTTLPELGGDTVSSFESVVGGAWITPTALTLRPRWRGAWVRLADATGGALGLFQVVDLDVTGNRMLLSGAESESTAVSFVGEYRFDKIELYRGAKLDTLDTLISTSMDLYAGEASIPAVMSAQDMTLHTGAHVRPAGGDSLALEVAGTLTIDSDAVLDVSALGYSGGTGSHSAGTAPSWAGAATYTAGASHGGLGIPGNPAGSPGGVYGSVYQPQLSGAGGSADSSVNQGGDGGGTLFVTATTLQLEGKILARGEDRVNGLGGYHAGAGAGGSVLLDVGVLTGSGEIDASGGDYDHNNNSSVGAPGGGGRVAIYASDLGGFDPVAQVAVRGGDRIYGTVKAVAGTGTLFVFDRGVSTYGRLILDDGQNDGTDRNPSVTTLPELGGDTVSSFESVVGGAWITPTALTLRPRWRGAWVRLADVSGEALGLFQVVDLDVTGNRILLSGAESESAAVSFVGEYRFDQIELYHGAKLDTLDTLISTSMDLYAGEASIPAVMSAQDMTLHTGAHVRPAGGDSLALEVAGTLTIDSDAVLDVSALGYSGGTGYHSSGTAPSWAGVATYTAGASHGGLGIPGNPAGSPGGVYGSVYQPQLSGAGGSADSSANQGGDGGGTLFVTATTLQLEGKILARGEDRVNGLGGYHAGAGAGGSVLLDVGVLTGSGEIDASGGDYDHNNNSSVGAPGGGGRVAIYASDLSGFDPVAQVAVRGGDRIYGTLRAVAGTGTVFVYENGSSTYGRLVLDNGQNLGVDRDALPTSLPALGSDDVLLVESTGSDAWLTPTSMILYPRWRGAWMTLVDEVGMELGSYEVIDLDTVGNRVLLKDAGAVGSVASFFGEYLFDQVDLFHGARLNASDPVDGGAVHLYGDASLPPSFAGSSLWVHSGGRLTPAEGGSLALAVSGVLTVESDAIIDVSALGYGGGTGSHSPGTAPSWVAVATYCAGASHGGLGIPGSPAGAPGEVYGSVYQPQLSGAGGSSDSSSNQGGDGGGSLLITATTLMLEGKILARGEDRVNGQGGYLAGGGAGGSVLIDVGVLAGSGEIDVSGGNYDHNGKSSVGAPGGGGRVAIYATDLAGFDIVSQVDVRGGDRIYGTVQAVAGTGTVFVYQDAVSYYGRLIVDNGQEGGIDRAASPTVLPTLGSDGVAQVAVDGSDLWVTPSTLTFHPRWLGAWMVLSDSVGTVIDTYRVLAVDAAGRAKLEGAASALAAWTLSGEYRFDVIDLYHGATAESASPVSTVP